MEQKAMNLMSRIKASSEVLTDRTVKAANVATKKATTVVESTKLNLRIFDLNSEMDQLYKELGRMLYDTHCGIEVDQEEIQVKLSLIDEKREAVSEIRAKLQSLKASSQCPNCGKQCASGDVFCSGCGAQL